MASNASGARTALIYTKETVWGTTPASPVQADVKRVRITGMDFSLNKETIASKELRSDRQEADMRHGTGSVSANVSCELSYGAFDDFLEALFFSTWATNVLKGGTAHSSFSMECGFLDMDTPSYELYSGFKVSSFSLKAAIDQIVDCTFGFVGKDITVGAASFATNGSTAAPTNSPYDTYTGSISIGGSSIAYITALNLNISNNLEVNKALFSKVPSGITAGRFSVSGSIEATFPDQTLFNYYKDETETTLSFVLGGASKKYTFLLPRVKFNSRNRPINNEGTITQSLDFRALYEGTTELTSLKLTRTP